jgi:membrane protein implicated in regulation of membrane protease activity
MALSEREQRLLDEMERNLLQHDADVVAPGANRGLGFGWLVIGILVAVVGLGVVIAGIGFRSPWLGIAGFAVLVVGALLAMRRTVPDVSELDGTSGRGAKPQKASFMSNLEDRWDRRRDERDSG